MFIMGIDGGGTKTRVELRDDTNSFLRRETYGAFNINSIGEDAFYALLRKIFRENMESCASVCVGAAGVSNQKVGMILEKVLKERNFAGKFCLVGDQEIALRGAMDTPGLAVIAGTGSICFGKNQEGRTSRSGGYGHLIDDGGSGYALGRDALSETVRTLDGREESVTLCRKIMAAIQAETPEQVVAFVYDPERKKSDIAALAAVVLQLAEEKDPAARKILRREAGELRELVRAVQSKLSLKDCPIALLGGLFSENNPYLKSAEQALSDLGQVKRPEHDALWGAAQMAFEQL